MSIGARQRPTQTVPAAEERLTFQRTAGGLREEQVDDGNQQSIQTGKHCTATSQLESTPRQEYHDNAPMYVRQLMLLNEGPVTMTTIKLNVQFDAVLNALAGARIRSPTISAGCVQQAAAPSASSHKNTDGAWTEHVRRARSCQAIRRRRTS